MRFSGKEPTLLDFFYKIYQSVEPQGFNHVAVCSCPEGSFLVVLHFRSGEHDNRNFLEIGLGANPSQDVNACGARHFHIEEEEPRFLVLGPVCVAAFSAEVSHGIIAIDGALNSEFDAGLCRGGLKQGRIVRVVVNMENGYCGRGLRVEC